MLLEGADRVAQSRLCNMCPASRGREISRFCDETKVVQLIEIEHKILLCLRNLVYTKLIQASL